MYNFLFLGDSITDCSHLWLPETNGLGNGFVSILAEKIKAVRPDAHIVNKGFDGFTTTALKRRLISFVSGSQADFICLLIGINDVGTAADNGQTAFEQQFKLNYGQLLESLRFLTDARILCVAPFVFPYPQRYSLWIPLIRSMEDTISELASFYQADSLLMQNILCSAARFRSSEEFLLSAHPDQTNDSAECKSGTACAPDYRLITTDGVHLTKYGHQVLADHIWPFAKQIL